MPDKICPVILSGGGGTRLWPMSTRERPKQFLPLTGGDLTLFEATIARVSDGERFLPPVIVTNDAQRGLCDEGLAIASGATLILEPVARNTAPAILLAARWVAEHHGADTLMLVMPSDHVIAKPDALMAAVDSAVPTARDDYLVTFGIAPTRPETGYGYIETGAPLGGAGALGVARFVEKPPLAKAEDYVAGGKHLWNAGIFLFSASAVLAAAERYAPDIGAPVEAAMRAAAVDESDGKARVVRPAAEPLFDAPSRSIDRALFELSDRVATVPVSAGWSDVGSWDSLIDIGVNPAGEDDVTLIDCDNVYAHSDGLHIAAVGVQDLIIVAHGNSILIVPRGQSQDVRRIVETLKAGDRADLL